MSTHAIAALSSVGPLEQPLRPETMPAGAASDFSGWLASGVTRLDASLAHAEAATRSLAADAATPTHDVMLSMEQARLTLMMAVEVRNRVVEGYQELLRMQL